VKNEKQVLEEMSETGCDAFDILMDADPKLAERFRKIDKQLIKLLSDVKRHFPDACYYTASGGFNLMLGNSHDDSDLPQQELLAMYGSASISDGDF